MIPLSKPDESAMYVIKYQEVSVYPVKFYVRRNGELIEELDDIGRKIIEEIIRRHLQV